MSLAKILLKLVGWLKEDKTTKFSRACASIIEKCFEQTENRHGFLSGVNNKVKKTG